MGKWSDNSQVEIKLPIDCKKLYLRKSTHWVVIFCTISLMHETLNFHDFLTKARFAKPKSIIFFSQRYYPLLPLQMWHHAYHSHQAIQYVNKFQRWLKTHIVTLAMYNSLCSRNQSPYRGIFSSAFKVSSKDTRSILCYSPRYRYLIGNRSIYIQK